MYNICLVIKNKGFYCIKALDKYDEPTVCRDINLCSLCLTMSNSQYSLPWAHLLVQQAHSPAHNGRVSSGWIHTHLNGWVTCRVSLPQYNHSLRYRMWCEVVKGDCAIYEEPVLIGLGWWGFYLQDTLAASLTTLECTRHRMHAHTLVPEEKNYYCYSKLNLGFSN